MRFCGSSLLVGLLLASGVWAGEGSDSSSLDDELLEGLSAPIDALDAGTAPAPAQPAPESQPAGQSIQGLTDQLMQELGAAADSETDDPLLVIARRMREAESRLAKGEAGPPLQENQEQILRDLDELIKQASKKCQGACSKPGSCNQPATRQQASQPKPSTPSNKPSNKPATNSVARTGPTGESPPAETTPADMRELLKRLWGELPDKAREQVLQSPVEEFLPRYELLIEEYFRRLAEDKQPE